MTGPISLSDHKATWLPLIRLRRSQLQKVARAQRDDPDFPWRAWARLVVNESLFLPGGVYQVDGDRQTWAAANAATALCFGKNAPFALPSDVPPEIMAECEAGAAKALAMGAHCLTGGDELGNKLGVTSELREELKVWFIWPAGATQEDLLARADARRAERRAQKSAATIEKRRAAGVQPREQYEAGSIASQARVMGIKPDTLRARLRRAPSVPSHVASVCPTNNIDSLSGDRPATKRDTIAGQARALGVKPDTLRKRLRRAACKAPPQSGARPPAQLERSGKVSCRKVASALGEPNRASRKRVAHPTIAGAARPSAAKEAATGPSAPLTRSPARSDAAPRPLHKAPPPRGARLPEDGLPHAHARGPDIAMRSPAAARGSFLGGVVRWLAMGRRSDGGGASGPPAAALAPGGQFVRLTAMEWPMVAQNTTAGTPGHRR